MKEGVSVTISKKSMKWIPWLLILPVVIIRGFTTELPENFFRSQSAYIYTFYSDFCSSINDIPCNIRRRSCFDIKYEI